MGSKRAGAARSPFPAPTESEEQRAIFEWAQLARGRWPELDLMYHITNEGKRSAATGAKLRAEGLKRGVPDICLPAPRAAFHGLYIELKRIQGSKTTKEQREWLEALAGQGYFTARCLGASEAIAVIQRYLKMGGTTNANN